MKYNKKKISSAKVNFKSGVVSIKDKKYLELAEASSKYSQKDKRFCVKNTRHFQLRQRNHLFSMPCWFYAVADLPVS